MSAQAATEVLAFARQLVGRAVRRSLTLRNTSQLPASWAVTSADRLPLELRLSAREGTLAPGAEAHVHVDFSSARECSVAANMVVKVRA